LLFKDNLRWLDKTKQLSMEIHPCFNVNWKQIIEVLKKYGFAIKLLDKNLREVGTFESIDMGYIWVRKP